MKFARMGRGITCSRNVESFSEAIDLKSNYENIKINQQLIPIQHGSNSRYVYKLLFKIIELNSSYSVIF